MRRRDGATPVLVVNGDCQVAGNTLFEFREIFELPIFGRSVTGVVVTASPDDKIRENESVFQEDIPVLSKPYDTGLLVEPLALTTTPQVLPMAGSV